MRKNVKLLIYSFSHFLMDFICHYYVFYLIRAHFPEFAALTILAYNFVAFALQCPIGYLADRFKGKYTAGVSFSLLLLGVVTGFMLFPDNAVGAVTGLMICAFANAGLHAGGCVAVMEPGEKGLKHGGVFIAAGALGVGLGDWLGIQQIAIFPAVAFAIPVAVLLLNLPLGEDHRAGAESENASDAENKTDMILLILCLIAVFVRSYGGFLMPAGFMKLLAPLEETESYGFVKKMFPSVLGFAGKFLGGFLVVWSMRLFKAGQDLRRANYIYGAAALVLSTILLSEFGEYAVPCAVGIILFHSVMPVTLFEIYCILPKNPGFSLGLTTLLLFLGCLPTYVWAPGDTAKRIMLACLMLIGALCLAIAAGAYKRKGKHVVLS